MPLLVKATIVCDYCHEQSAEVLADFDGRPRLIPAGWDHWGKFYWCPTCVAKGLNRHYHRTE